jgi:mRNA-degrading endonuclease toxin of MazEF toxin-antitoxin module
VIERGDIRWFRFERPDKRRPVLVLGRRVEWIRAVDRTAVGPRIAALPAGRWPEVKRAVVHVLGLDEE